MPLFADRLKMAKGDPLLSLIAAYKADPRSDKIDLGVGVYRTEDGQTPVMAAVKAAEQRLWEIQPSKEYLGPDGDPEFVPALGVTAFGSLWNRHPAIGLATPGGTGALRLAADLIALVRPGAKVYCAAPTWPNHPPILSAAGLTMTPFDAFDAARQRFDLASFEQGVADARAGDVLLLQGCCHNPLGADPDLEEWRAIADIVRARRLVPLIDLAYQGLGEGWREDIAGATLVIEAAEEALVAYSCDKNFGLYRDRVGAIFAFTQAQATADAMLSNLVMMARTSWSMPPDHGAATVRILLQDPALKLQWEEELTSMQRRIAAMRRDASRLHPALASLALQKGMFSVLPLSPQQIVEMRERHGVYMAPSGRINVAGLTPANLDAFASAMAAVCGAPATV